LWASNLLLNVQVVILIIIPKMAGSRYLNTKNLLKFVVIFQYVPRFMRIYPLYKEVTTSGILTETAWAGAAFNLFLYMLASHVSLIYSTGIHFIVK
jgi:cyclic nucleotide gated channel